MTNGVDPWEARKAEARETLEALELSSSRVVLPVAVTIGAISALVCNRLVEQLTQSDNSETQEWALRAFAIGAGFTLLRLVAGHRHYAKLQTMIHSHRHIVAAAAEDESTKISSFTRDEVKKMLKKQ